MWPAALADVALVLVFVLVGRRNHQESSALLGVAATAWPFLLGLGAGWGAARVWHHPARPVPEGVTVWLVTVGVGMVLRGLGGQNVPVSFVVVTLVVLGVFLLGWRGVVTAHRRGSPRARGPADGGGH